jgi:hypothetical protein
MTKSDSELNQWSSRPRSTCNLARDGVTFEKDAKALDLDRKNENVDIAKQLESWQAEGDRQMWKLPSAPFR